MGGCVQHGNCGGFDSLHRKGPCRDRRAGRLTTWRELPGESCQPRHAMSSPGAGPLCRASCPPSAHLKCKQPLHGDILREGYLQIYFCVQTPSPGIVRRDDGMQPWSRRTCTERWCTLRLWPATFLFLLTVCLLASHGVPQEGFPFAHGEDSLAFCRWVSLRCPGSKACSTVCPDRRCRKMRR